MTITAHIFSICVALFSVGAIVIMTRRHQLRAKYALLWVPTGLGMLVLSAFPGLLDRVSVTLGVFYPPTVIFVAAVTLLLLVAVHLSWEVSRLDERVRALAEHIALQDAQTRELLADAAGRAAGGQRGRAA